MRGQFRTGRVLSNDTKRHTARVRLDEVDGLDTFDLQVLVTRPDDYSLPPKDAPVLCVLLDDPHQGLAGDGFVLGVIYTESDAAPLDDAGQRSIAGDDIRLGAPDASDAVALASKVKQDLDDLKTHFQAVEGVITGAVIDEPGNGAPSALQAALKTAIGLSPYPSPGDVGADKVKAK